MTDQQADARTQEHENALSTGVRGNELPALTQDLVGADHPMATVLNASLYNQLKSVASTFAQSQLVPEHFRNKPHDVFIALHMAKRLGCDPILVLQNIYIVQGTPGWKANFVVGQANMSKVFGSKIRWRTERYGEPLKTTRMVGPRGNKKQVDVTVPNISVTAYAKDPDGGDDLEAEVSMQMAIDEGWTENPKYTSMGEHMLKYRAATFLIRLYAPEVLLGVPVADELDDIAASEPPAEALHEEQRTAEGDVTAADITSSIQAKAGGAGSGKAPAQKTTQASAGGRVIEGEGSVEVAPETAGQAPSGEGQADATTGKDEPMATEPHPDEAIETRRCDWIAVGREIGVEPQRGETLSAYAERVKAEQNGSDPLTEQQGSEIDAAMRG